MEQIINDTPDAPKLTPEQLEKLLALSPDGEGVSFVTTDEAEETDEQKAS